MVSHSSAGLFQAARQAGGKRWKERGWHQWKTGDTKNTVTIALASGGARYCWS
ncbi:hypothetical protein [Commensalibacter melissae]|uniref:hypothetical protein n=1 Tax=Commensalibacter melissae TaxID=2070537 RepID=UPI0012D943E0|nr:hypothetical protein [Commensalibacter melissae]MUH07276.1 hypothetical protein [Commensalibacter melissae]